MTECERFHEHAEELALDAAPASLRDDLLAHAASCTACQAHLDALVQVADRLLLTVTEIEPPEGFEARVLARLRAIDLADGEAEPTDAPIPLRPISADRRAARNPVGGLGRGRGEQRGRRILAIAAALVVLAGGGFAIDRLARSRSSSPTASAVTRSGVIVRKDGSTAGHAELLRAPVAHVLVTIDHPQPNPGRVSCRLTLADGTSVVVGTWGYEDVRAGVWSVGIDRTMLFADRMDVLDGAGTIVASATLH